MRTTTKAAVAMLLACAALSTAVEAKVTQYEAAQLRNRLTPLGGERVGSPSGTIPAWQNGLVQPPPCYRRGARYCDPYAGEAPVATITAANIDHWRDHLSAGMIEALLTDSTYSVTVYPSHRSFANPVAVYEAAYQNALSAGLTENAQGVVDASVAIPFPIPKNGVELIWNHQLRWRGAGSTRLYSQATTTPSGEPVITRFREDWAFPFARGPVKPKDAIAHYLQFALEPKDQRGTILLAHLFADPVANPADAYAQVPGSTRMRRQQAFGYDNPNTLAAELRFDDQIDGYTGSADRYLWRMAGKREIVVPYNAYGLDSGHKTLREVLRPQHLDPRYLRYEMHRVWVLDGTVRPGMTHRYKRRTIYFDEDSWQILLVDLYDSQDRLWRWQEAHTVMAYDRMVLLPVVETVYDLIAGRYLVQGPDEGDPEVQEASYDEDHFSQSSARSLAH